jgi:hypothetical protein
VARNLGFNFLWRPIRASAAAEAAIAIIVERNLVTGRHTATGRKQPAASDRP